MDPSEVNIQPLFGTALDSHALKSKANWEEGWSDLPISSSVQLAKHEVGA
jgi:hypothetical protein